MAKGNWKKNRSQEEGRKVAIARFLQNGSRRCGNVHLFSGEKKLLGKRRGGEGGASREKDEKNHCLVE